MESAEHADGGVDIGIAPGGLLKFFGRIEDHHYRRWEGADSLSEGALYEILALGPDRLHLAGACTLRLIDSLMPVSHDRVEPVETVSRPAAGEESQLCSKQQYE